MAFNYVLKTPGQPASSPIQASELKAALTQRLSKRNPKWLVRIITKNAKDHIVTEGPWRLPADAPGFFTGTILQGDLTNHFSVRGKLRVLFIVQVVPSGLPEKHTTTIPGPSGSTYDLHAGNDEIARIGRVAQAQDTGTHCNGLAFTRHVAGSSIWSQHSVFFNGANAIDLTWPLPPPVGNNLIRQRLMVEFLRKNGNELNIHKIISEEHEYNAPNFAQEYYGGTAHVSHTHVECEPYHSESPHGF